MAIPPPSVIEQLFADLTRHNALGKDFGEFSKVWADIKKTAKSIAIGGAQTALQYGVTAAAPASGLVMTAGAVSITAFPIGAVLGPWLAAGAIYFQADGIFALHDLKQQITRGSGQRYPCRCGKCAAALQYIIDKKENNTAILAVSVFTAGLPLLADKMHSWWKRGEKGRPKEMHSRQFILSARGGCICAMAAILLLCGKWPADKPPSRELMEEALAILLASDGWVRLHSKW